MAPPEFPRLLSIVGPTAAGKSRFAVEVALRFGGEIVSCDSMAVYRGLDIGTDKPSPAERRGVPHHLLDVAEPGTVFSAGAFRALALQALSEIHGRARLAILTGGTGLYYRALTRGLVEAPGRQEAIRRRLLERAERRGPESLHRLLRRLDPGYAATIGPRDLLRTVRALEVRLASGRPLSAYIRESPFGSRAIPGLTVGLTAPKSFLYHRIDRRVEEMVAAGLLNEVRGLWESGRLRGPVRKAIGYGELAAFLEGSLSLEEAVRLIQRRSRNLARRQLAWFRREEGIQWFEIQKEAWTHDALECIERWLEETPRQP